MSSFSYEYGTLNIQPSNTPHTHRSSHLFNSTSKLQDFFGVDDIQELKINIPPKRNSAPVSQKIKSIFHTHKQNKKTRRECKKIRRGLNKLRKENKQKTTTFHTKNEKILWRPSLKTIFSDHILLNVLTKFMENSYNSENILFLQAVHALNGTNNENINDKIINIYNKFIIPYCEYQINLSYHCLMNIMSKKDEFMCYNDVKDKRKIFSLCVQEIENLIITSILGSFYTSSFFQLNARKSKFFIDNHPKYYHNNSSSNSSQYSPYSSLSTPPIQIESSISTESFFDFDA